MAEGYGTFVKQVKFSDGSVLKYTYEGNWEKDKMHGYGIESWQEGLVYKGYFTNGLKGPRGIMQYTDGDVYDGEFFNDMINGNGRLFNLKKNFSYNGTWKDNQMHGSGTYQWEDGRRYCGEYKNG